MRSPSASILSIIRHVFFLRQRSPSVARVLAESSGKDARVVRMDAVLHRGRLELLAALVIGENSASEFWRQVRCRVINSANRVPCVRS
jgi:hypothetical protein